MNNDASGTQPSGQRDNEIRDSSVHMLYQQSPGLFLGGSLVRCYWR